MDAEIDTTDNGGGNEEDVEVELFFRKPPEINNFELVKTFCIDPTEVINSTNEVAQEDQNNKPSSDPEVKVLQPLALRPLETAEDESGGSSCSHSEDVRLPDEILDEPLDDEVFEEEEEKTEHVETDLVFRQPKDKEMELVYTISKSAVFNLDGLEEEDEDVDVDLWFREPTDTRFELVYTIPLMEDVSVDSLGETLEDLPSAEELDNVVEEASVAEFTFKPIENDEETETVTTEVVTVLERGGGEGSRDFIEKVKLTSNDTFDNFDDEGEDAFQNAFVKSVETPETPVPEYDENQEDIIQDVSVSDVLKDAAEKLQIIQDSENTGTLKQTASAPEFVSDIRTPEGSPDETETTRFEISSVDEKDITLPDTDNVPFLEVTQETDRVPSQEPSDYAQLESISSPDDVPDVDRTLNSLKNEDVFPKEAIPNEVPKIEVTPEAETLPVVGLEDSGMVETPKVAGLSKEDVAEALNAEDVITGDDGVLAATPDVLSVDNHAKDDDPVIEDSGEVETTEVIELKQDVIEAALNSEDVLTDSHVMPQNETTQGDQPVEESGAIESPSVVDLNSEVVTDALNSEDVNSQTELPDGSNPDNTTSEEKPQPVLKLEDSGIVETPDLVELDKEDVVDALNSEDVLTEADVVQISTEIHDNETPIEDQPVADLEDSGPTEVVAGALNSEDVQKEDDTTSVLDEPVLKLEDSGIVETSEVVALDHQDALNSQEDECAVVSSEVTETSEATHEAETINGSNGDENPVDDSMIGLVEGGDVETANAVELSNEIAADALNSEDVTGVTSLPVVYSEVYEGEQEFNIEETPVVKLEDSGVAETPDIVELDREVVEDALNSEDAQKEDNTTSVLDEPVLKLEDSGIVETSEVVALDHQDVKDPLNSEDALLETEGAVVSSQVTETLEATHEADTIDGLNGKENPVHDSMIWQENQPVIGLEDGGDVGTANVVELSNEIAADALNSEDVTGVTSISVVDSEVHEGEQEFNIEETPVVNLEDSGVAETPDIVELDGEVVEDALNSEDVVNETTAVAEASESHEATQEEELHREKTAAEDTVLGLEESGEVEPVDVVAVSNQEIADAMNGEDVVKVAEEVAGEEAEQVYSELPPEAEESVVDSQSEEDQENQEDQEKESTPVAGTEEQSTEKEGTLVDKLVSMVEDTLPVDAVAISDEMETPEESKETRPETSEPESETVIDADNERKDLDKVLDSSEDQSKPEEAAPAPEETMVQKLVSMVENVLPAETVIPSEDVVSEEHIEEREKDEQPAETSENRTIMEKLVSMVENIAPVETQDESLSPAVEEQESNPVAENSEESKTPKDTQPEKTFVEKFVSVVENALPVDAVLPSEDVLSEDHVEEPVIELSSENAEDSTILDKLTSVAESVLPSKDNKNIGEEKETTEENQATENSELNAEPTIMEKLTSMVENVIPSKDSVPEEPVVEENQINDVAAEPTLMEQLTSMVESVLPTQEPVKETELVEDTTPEDSAAPEPTLIEKLTSMVESVLPSKDEVSEENNVETTVEVSETDEAAPEPTILEKLASMVEHVFPADAILLSEYVRQSEERNSEARQAEELEPENESEQVLLEKTENLEAVSATQDSADTTEAEKVLEPEEEKDSGEIVPSSEDTTSEDRSGEFKKPIERETDTALDSSEDQSKPEEAEPTPEETMVQKLVSMVEDVLPAEAVLPSEDVVSEEHIEEREEDEQPAETSEKPTILEKLVSMVENIVPVEDESLPPAVEEQESNRVPENSEKTKTSEDTQPKETFVEKLVSMVENALPVSTPQEEPDDTQRYLNEENQIISTSDIILPFEENTSLETPFDAEGFTEPPVEKEKQESFKEPTAEDIIETADIILPVEEKESKNIETPFDAEGFVSEDPVETPVKNEIQQEDVTDETQPEKSTVVEELLAMAVDILPIDGTVAEKIEEESLVEKTTVEAFETPNEDPGEFRESGTSDPELPGVAEYVPEESQPLPEKFERVKRGGQMENKDDTVENEMQVATVEVEVNNEPQETINPTIQVVEVTVQSDDNHPEDVPTSSQDTEEHLTKTDQHQEPHKITDVHFDIPKHHDDYGNDYVPFGTEPSARVEFNNPEESKEEEEDFVAELNFHPIRQWKDEDVISLQSLKSLVAEVGCTTDVSVEPHQQAPEDNESTLKILKVVPSEPSLMELDISNDPSVIHVPIPLLEPAIKYLEEMVEWIIADAVKEVGEMEVVTESEISEMVAQESENECPVPEPLADLKLPTEDDEKTPEPETPIEVARVIPVEVEPVQTIPQRPPRAPKVEGSKLDTSKSLDQHNKSKVRFRPLNIKLGRSYSEEQQKELVEMLERPLTVITSSEQKPSEPKPSPLSPNTLDEYEHVPMMDMQSVPHSPQEKLEEVVEENEEQKEEPEDLPMVEQIEQPVGFVKKVEVKTVETPEDVHVPQTKIFITETRILGAGKSTEYVDDEDGSECLDSIGDLSERTIQRFNTSIDDPSIRRDSFSSISSFGDRLKFRTAIENIRQDLLPFQSSVSQYLDPSVNPSQQLLVTNLSMDSPSDLSPNAPPAGYENTAQYLEKLQQEDRPSAEGSIDSSGFEKVDHESLEDYTAPVHDPMQKSVFGSLTADSDDLMSSHHDDVIEKNYFGNAEDAATAKLLESPIAEEARKLVQDAVESASEYSKHATGDDDDEIGRELLDNVQHKFEQVKEPVADTLHKAYDGLGDFVHDTVPQAVDNFVEEVKNRLPESPVPEKVETPEPLVDIHDSVDQVHDEIDNYLRREPTPPLVEADENAPSFDQKPQFGNQTPEEDETTYDRKGPLTIPEEVEKAAAAHKYEDEDLDEFDPLVTGATGTVFGAAVGAAAASEALTEEEMFGHQKFETVPRPPTPPKELNDDDVKPSTVNLGPAHHHSHPSSPHHSILKHHGEAWFDFKTVPPCVLDVIYWRDAKKSAIVLSLALLALFILAKYPLLTVVTYSLLLALGAAAGFRAYKKIEAQIKKTDTENPFNEILAKDLSLPQEKVHAQADVITEHATCVANKLKKLIFVESPLESIKFGLILWSLTYVASWFSGCTLAVLALLGTFSIPKVYEANQEAIDPHLATISGHLKNVQNLIDEKLPFLRSAPVAAEEKKDQ